MKNNNSIFIDKKFQFIVNLIVKSLEDYWFKEDNYIPSQSILDCLVATILSQNTSDVNSSKAFIQLKLNYPNWIEFLNVKEEELAAIIKIAGLANQKAKAILNAISVLYKKYNNFDLLELNSKSNEDLIIVFCNLKGIGVKTASCVLMFSLYRDVCPIDTHVFRITNRLGIISEKNPDKAFYILDKILPKNSKTRFHLNLIMHGRNICKPQKPFCGSCPVFIYCKWDHKSNFEDFKFDVLNVKNNFFLMDNLI